MAKEKAVVVTVGPQAFASCSKLLNVAFEGTPTTIGSCAFSSCSSLPCITIPSGVANLETPRFSSVPA
jgi:hypothetical protein